jgi:hypothetical protein
MFRDFDLSADDWTFSIDKLSPASVEKARQLLREFTDTLAKIAEQDRALSRSSAAFHLQAGTARRQFIGPALRFPGACRPR